MIAHIAKLTNAVVAIEKDEPFMLKYVLVLKYYLICLTIK